MERNAQRVGTATLESVYRGQTGLEAATTFKKGTQTFIYTCTQTHTEKNDVEHASLSGTSAAEVRSPRVHHVVGGRQSKTEEAV